MIKQAAIRKELNEFKSLEMEVHEESRHMTRYAFIYCAPHELLIVDCPIDTTGHKSLGSATQVTL